jgi:6-pyruvoyltetrahydropterin/6-carboxytetrahydropterin synthase
MTHTITRTTTFDSGHRVMNERMKCFNIHGHTYKADVTWRCFDKADIGYAIDFKEIKRVYMQWIDDYLDHGFIANPHDHKVIDLVNELGNKLWVMSLNGPGEYCNPSAENIALEMFYCLNFLTSNNSNELIVLDKIELWETPNCMVTVDRTDALDGPCSEQQYSNIQEIKGTQMLKYLKQKGTLEYDDRLFK